ncbi:MAG: hypothetical protein E6G51_10245 [Actinobacteria bacterium]|nr:MAG: hypothetical protein E6G51_10245 [Actinomycetota bacterium]
MKRIGPRLALLLALVAALFLSGFGVAAEAAHVVNVEEASFDGSDAPGGPLRFVVSVASDGSGDAADGNVYVGELFEKKSEMLASRILAFDEDGDYAGVTVDGSTTPRGSISFFDPEAGNVAFDGIAIDDSAGPNRGDVYAVDVVHGLVDRFDSSGQFLCQITGRSEPAEDECGAPGQSATPDGGFVPVGLAVDPNSGELYVCDGVHKVIDRFGPSGEYLGQIADPHLAQPSQIEVDSTGALYVVGSFFFDGEAAVKFDPAGNFEAVVDANNPVGVAVDRATDDVYFSHSGEEEAFAEYDSAGNLLHTFGIGQEEALPALAVNAATGRLYAGQVEPGLVRIFSPDTFVPDVSADPPGGVGETSAELSGQVDPAGAGDVTLCRFEFGPTTHYGDSVPCSPATPYSSPTEVTAELTGLNPSTTYHFRLAAANEGVPPYTRGVKGHSADGVIVTDGPPTIEAEAALAEERTGVVLEAEVMPHGFDTVVQFQFVDETHFETEGFAGLATRTTPLNPIGSGPEPVPVSAAISGLQVGTVYRYRTVAVNSRGTVEGPIESFATLPVVGLASQWAYPHFSDATLEARVNTLGLTTSCKVEYVEESAFEASGYADATALPCASDLATEGNPQTARREIGGLRPDTAYHFRFVLANSSGTLRGEDQRFSTFGIESFRMEVVDEKGQPFTQAGGPPFESITHYGFNHSFVQSSGGTAGSLDAFLKDLITEQPPGRVGSTTATPRCPGYVVDQELCPGDTQVGTMTIEYFEEGTPQIFTRTRELYNVIPPRGVTSRYSSVDPYTSSDAHIRSGSDYGTTSGGYNITEEARIIGVTARVWGVPADPSHDAERRCPGIGTGCASTAARLPLLRNPTSCTGPLTVRGQADTYQAPGIFVEKSFQMPAITGCDKLKFEPTLEWRPTSTEADAPTGLHVHIHIPQNEDPDGNSTADLRDLVVKTAPGMVINPSAADGLIGCSPEQVDLGGDGPPHCPDASKVGSAEVITPLLNHPLHGGIYIATPHANPFDTLFAIYLTLDDPETGVVVKLPGRIDPNGQNGQLTTSFSEDPQLPVEDFNLDFFGGPRAVLRTPPGCGTYATEGILTPWSAPQSGPPVHTNDSYRISSGPNGSPCPGREGEAAHQPAFAAGTASNRAGSFSPFSFQLSREDGTQQLVGLGISPPPGLLGKLAGIPYCPDQALVAAGFRPGRDEIALPSCSAASQLGEVTVGAGAGPRPFYIHGKAYLAGPYRGAPVSLAVVVPAVAGPYDLGTVVVRSGLGVDLESGRISVASDPLPTVLEGVSLDVRSIAVKLNRPEFTLNPTNCEAAAVEALVTSVFGRSASLSVPFRAVQCGTLKFEPRLSLRLLGKTARGQDPGLRAALRMPPGNANIARVGVNLPSSEFLDTTHIRGICTRVEFVSDSCPRASVYGKATAWTPLLDKPLSGPIYLRASEHRLPDLVADLHGQVRLAIAGQIGSSHGGISTGLAGLPDAAVRKFVLTVFGGDGGLLQNSKSVCLKPRRATIEFEAQNGSVKVLHPRLRAHCRKGSSPHRR